MRARRFVRLLTKILSMTSIIIFILALLLFAGFAVFAFVFRIVAGIRRGVSGIFGGGTDKRAGRSGTRRPGAADTAARPRGKRIHASQGEYVDYEEIACDVDRNGDHNPKTVYTETEEQVTDAEWEEIR